MKDKELEIASSIKADSSLTGSPFQETKKEEESSSNPSPKKFEELVKIFIGSTFSGASGGAMIPSQEGIEESGSLDFGQFKEGEILKAWKNVVNIKAQLIDFDDDFVRMECLLDKETKHYEAWEFPTTLFEDYELRLGKLFYLQYFERSKEIKLEIHDNPDLVLASDFPKIDFAKKFGQSKLFKKNK